MLLKEKKNYLIYFALILLFLPSSANAEWYWMTVISDPNTGYFIEEVSPNTIGYTPTETTDPYSNKTLVPDNFMDTIEETEDSDKCSGELDSAIQKLRQFDANEEIVTPSKCGSECSPYYANPEQTMASREQLLLELESDAQSCLIDEQEEIEEAIKEQERKEAEEARIIEVHEAVSECDFDYFENEMTNKERMDTWEQREACKQKEEIVSNAEEVTAPTIENVRLPEVTPTKPEPTYTPAITLPINTNADPVAPDLITETNEPESTNTIETAEEIIEQNSESGQPATIEPVPEKQSFIKKIISFFTRWF